jgi:hypothetical protein
MMVESPLAHPGSRADLRHACGVIPIREKASIAAWRILPRVWRPLFCGISPAIQKYRLVGFIP